ncbi:MAG TPA: pyridoxal-phosphate dependent enzyme, partial [Actinomycetota bacterium]|nr:pyridoxal-phosphate dependent enzyme [Actinomycetota bacterium]
MSERLVDTSPGRNGAVAHRPDPLGHFGSWGGRFVPEVLMAALDQLTEAFEDAIADDGFGAELDALRRDYAGRPTPLFPARRLSEELGVAVWLKREDLLHTGAHKLNNSLGQHLLTRRMGKPRVIAETGAGQHGVATATAATALGLECVVYMGEKDVKRQELNVFRMELLGAEVRPVGSGSRTLKDAINEAMRDWVASVATTHYCIGSVMGPHPYPWMVRELQRIIGAEARPQCRALLGDADPDVV